MARREQASSVQVCRVREPVLIIFTVWHGRLLLAKKRGDGMGTTTFICPSGPVCDTDRRVRCTYLCMCAIAMTSFFLFCSVVVDLVYGVYFAWVILAVNVLAVATYIRLSLRRLAGIQDDVFMRGTLAASLVVLLTGFVHVVATAVKFSYQHSAELVYDACFDVLLVLSQTLFIVFMWRSPGPPTTPPTIMSVQSL